MKRVMFLSAILGSLALATAASADNGQQNSQPKSKVAVGNRFFLNQGNNSASQNRRLGNLGQIINQFAHNDKKDKPKPQGVPIDPGIGNGQPTAPTTPTIPTRPGYVWVGDHWERERAPQGNNIKPPMVADPVLGQPLAPQGKPGYVWVGDHWERVKAQPTNTTIPPAVNQPPMLGPVIRDHRTSTQNGVFGNQGGIVVRDHRTPKLTITDASQAPGGVVVTSSPRPRRPASTGGGNGLVSSIGQGLSGIGNAMGNALGTAGNAVGIGNGSITPAGGSAKPVYNAPPAATVRDHRSN